MTTNTKFQVYNASEAITSLSHRDPRRGAARWPQRRYYLHRKSNRGHDQ